MRLLNVKNYKFADYRDDKQPKYAILSHRWGNSEVTFQDVQNELNQDKSGYKKIIAFADYVREHVDETEWVWVDTCCINKDSAAELSEAINLMFKWYYNAEVCLAYLADVDVVGDMQSFHKSEWFERGWTLQELLAPRTVIFVTGEWKVIGNKGASSHHYLGSPSGNGLETEIAARTGITKRILDDFSISQGLSIEERLRWMEGRETSRAEDMSYALYGIFGVTPGANYGEGRDGARKRLLGAIHHEKVLAARQAEQFRKIAAWLSPPDPWTDHNSARQRHEPQTGTWLLDCDEYRVWKIGSLRHLWVDGKAGCGKTVLCSTAIEDVRRHCENAANAGYAIFYLSFSDNQKQRYEDALLSWVAQLGWKEPALSMLQQAYEKPNQNKPGQDELEKILLSCIETYDQVFLLIDALDECPEDSDMRHYMMECLARLSCAAPQLKILATSRKLPDIQESMVTLGAEHISIETHSVDADIRKYTTTQLSRDHRLSRLDQGTKALIEDRISKQADGMFRWAFCQMQELKKLKSTRPKVVEKALHSLPATLDKTYERMLIDIEETLRPDALKLLRWLAYAKSPLRLGELVDAAIIDWEGEGYVEVDNRPGLDDTLEILSGLVTIVGGDEDEDEEDLEDVEDIRGNELESEEDEVGLVSHRHRRQQIRDDTRVRLAHFSVKEYLESKRILEGSAKDFYFEGFKEHRILSQSCITYITHYSRSEEKLSTEQDLRTFPLLEYAAVSWFYHSALQRPTRPTYELGLLCDDGILRDWLEVCQPDHIWAGAFSGLGDIGSGLYYAGVMGLEQVVGALLARADVNAQEGHLGNALQAASWRGHSKVVKMLIHAGAEVNAQGGEYGNALQAASASYGGDELKVVQMLIDAGAEVNAQGGFYGNALQAASYGGYEKIVQMLTDAGAEVNAQGGHYGNALQAASWGGHSKVVQMLIDAGAEVNAQGGHFGYALQAASWGSYEKLVQMLIDAGAEVNAQGGEYGNALQAAAASASASYGGNEKVVQMLIDAGAEVNAQGGQHGNALQAALYGGDEKVVQMLIHAGAEVNAQGGLYGNALQAASYGGDEKVVQMLIQAGAEANAQGGHFGYALQAASDGGDEKVVQMLIHAGAEVNAQGGKYGNALQAASYEGHEKVVQMLIHAGAEVNAQGGEYGNALQAASYEGHEKVVQMLIDAGAEVNAQGGLYGNTLRAASDGGDEKVVQMLIDTRAEVAFHGGDFGNALQAASWRGHSKVVQMLIHAGAEVNAQGGQYGNALQTASASASYGGNEKVVQMLIDAGAKVNFQGGPFGNALQAASARGHEKVVQMLIDAGAEVNAQGGHFGNALQAASDRGHEKLVQMLIDAGAEVNAQGGGRLGDALQAASSTGHEKVVQMLLETGANVNEQRGIYSNALQAASLGGHSKVVQMLIHAGAKVNAQGGQYGNALQAASASFGGYEKVVQMLIDAGAEVNAQGGQYGNALQAAAASASTSWGGNEKVVQMLIHAGAEVNAQGGQYGNALQAASASYGGYEKLVQMLIDAGAEVNAQGGHFGNALQAASDGGDEKVVQMLIHAGAEVNAQGGLYGNALQAASYGGDEKVVQMLLEAGANVNEQGGQYGNALQAASLGGHSKVVQVLLAYGARE